MRHSLDTLDDEILTAGQQSSVGGQVSNARASQLNETQLVALRDIEIDTLGIARSRRGFHVFGDLYTKTLSINVQGLWFYQSTAKQELLAMVDGYLWAIDSGGTATIIDNGGAYVLPIYEVTEDGDRVTTEDGAWIILNTPVRISGDGASQYAPCFFAQVGDKVLFSFAQDGELIKQYDGTTITTDGLTVHDALRCLTAQAYRVFGVRKRDELHVSKILPNTLDGVFTASNNSIQVGDGDGDPITAIFSWLDTGLAVFKRTSTFLVDTNPATVVGAADGTSASGFTVKKVSDRIGCVASRTVAQVGQDVIFLARDGVRSLQRTLTEGMNAVGPALSFPVDDIIRLIDWSDIDAFASAFTWREKYFLTLPVVGMETDFVVLVLNARTQSWSFFTGVEPLFWCPVQFSGQAEKLLMLDNSGRLMEFRDWVPENSATSFDYKDEFDAEVYQAPPFRWLSRAFNFDLLLRNKQLDFAEIEFDKSRALVDVWLWVDGVRYARVSSLVETGTEQLTLPLTLPFTLPITRVIRKRIGLLKYGGVREAQIEIVESEPLTEDQADASFNLGVRQLIMGAFEDPYEVDT